MTAKELAEKLDGRQYGKEMTIAECREARDSGLVVIFGASDDLMEVRGAIDDEFDCWGGGTFQIANGYFVKPRCDDCKGCDLFKAATKDAQTIRALWAKGEAAWTYETEMPHETFRIIEDDELYCIGIVLYVGHT